MVQQWIHRTNFERTGILAEIRSISECRGPRERSFERILNSVPHVLWTADVKGRVDFVSAHWKLDLGGDPTLLLGDGWVDFIYPDDRQRTIDQWSHSVTTGEPFSAEYRLRVPDQTYRWVLAKARAEKDELGNIRRWFGGCTDIGDRVAAEQELRNSERLHRGVLEASPDCIKLLTPDGRLAFMNSPGLEAMEVENFDTLRGQFWPSLWPEESRAGIIDAIKTAHAGETVRFEGQCPTAKGVFKWWEIVVTPIQNDEGSVASLLAISHDITSKKARCAELLWASEHDSLTLLPNRRAFQHRLQSATLRAMADDAKVGLLLIDLDHFKNINDTMGHAAGDVMLQAFARQIREAVRDEYFVARVGGDEFAIIIEGAAGREALLQIGRTVARYLKVPIRVHDRTLSGGASIGGALFPDDAATANDLFKVADTALYRLKADGRGGTRLFESHMLAEAERVASQLDLARTLLTERTVLPFYQPKVRLRDNRLCGVEALLRWRHPHRGIQLPETIEEAFKDYELASKIGALMQRKVAQDIHSWIDLGIEFGRVSINASPAEFLRDDYAERLLDLLKANRVPPHLIEVEITEHVLVERGSQYVVRALSRLKAAGMTIALDDFGTGHSSLAHLRDFPVDVVKIDRSFVRNILVDPEIAAIVSAVIGLAGSLGLETVAEGVESFEQAELLRGFGCHIAQGYAFGIPAEAEIMKAAFARKRAA